MKKYTLTFFITFAVVLAAAYFGKLFTFNTPAKHSGHDHAHSHAHEHAADEGVHLTPEQLKHVKIVVSKAETGSVRRLLELHGEVKLNGDRTAKIMQRVPGFVTRVCAKQGDFVKKGTLLARLTSEKLGEYYSNYYSGKALEDVAKSEFNMAQKLYANKAMAEKEYLRYKRACVDAGIARRKAEVILRSLELDPDHRSHRHGGDLKEVICTEYDVVSPITGTVVAKNISPGEKYADDNTQVLFMVSDLEKPWLELQADYHELKAVRNGMSVDVNALVGGGSAAGKVIYVSQMIDGGSRKGFIRVELDNKEGKFRSGEFALGRIQLDTGRKSVVIPRDAVQLISGETVVFVPANGHYITRVVKTGDSSGGAIEIVSGLAPGEKYISQGAFSLKAVLLTTGMDPHAGHGH